MPLCTSDQVAETQEVTKLGSGLSQIVMGSSKEAWKYVSAEEATSGKKTLILRGWLWESFCCETPWLWLPGSQRSPGHKSNAWIICLLTHSSTQPTRVMLHCNTYKLMWDCCWLPVPSTVWSTSGAFVHESFTINLWVIVCHYDSIRDDETEAWGVSVIHPRTPSWETMQRKDKPGAHCEKVPNFLYKSLIFNLFQTWVLN